MRSTTSAAWVLVAIMVVPSLASGGVPETRAARLDTPRYGMAAVSDGSSVFLIGGYDAEQHYRPEVLRYDPATDTLELRATLLPSGRAYASAVWTGTYFFVFGGFDGHDATNEILRYDPATDDVVVMTAKLPTARYGTSAVWTGEVAYVFGGMQDLEPPYHDEVVVYDPATDTARPLALQLTPNRGTYATSAVWDGTAAYVFGGDACVTHASAGTMSTQSLPIFIVGEALEMLQELPPPPNPRVTYDCEARADVVRFDPRGESLSRVATLPSPRFGTSAAWSGGNAYVFGGHDGSAGLDAIVRFTPSDGTVVATASRFESPLWDSASAWLGGHAWVVGGRDPAGPRADVLRYTVTAPPPSGLTAVAGDLRGEILLAWEQPVDADAPEPTAYRVFRDGAPVATVAGRSWTDTGLQDGRTFAYRVAAVNDGGQGFLSGSAWARTLPGVPSAPRDLSGARGPAAGQVRLTWAAPEFDGDHAIVGYRVYRTGPDGGATLAFETPDASGSDLGLADDTPFTYAVRAVNSEGEGAPSAPVVVRTPAVASAVRDLVATPGPDGGQVSLAWTAPADDGGSPVVAYRVFRDAELVGETATAAFLDGGRGPSAEATYRVLAVNDVGAGPAASVVGRTFALASAPLAPLATAGPNGGQVTLDWTPPADDGGSRVRGWRIERDDGVVLDALGGRLSAFEGGEDGFVRAGSPAYGSLAVDAPARRVAVIADHRDSGPTSLLRAASRTCDAADAFATSAAFAVTARGAYSGFKPLVLGPASARGRVHSTHGAVFVDYYSGSTYYGSTPTLSVTYVGAEPWRYNPAYLNAVPRTLASLVPTIGTTYRVTIAYDPGTRAVSATIADAGGATLASGTHVLGPREILAFDSYGVAIEGWSGSGTSPVRAWVDDVRFGGACATGATDEGLGPGVARTYRVRAVTAAGEGALGAPVGATTFAVPDAPREFVAAAGPRGGEATLGWGAPGSDGGAPVRSYVVYRDGVRRAETTTRAFVDQGLAAGSVHAYAVSAVTSAGEGPQTSALPITAFVGPATPLGLEATPGAARGRVEVAWRPAPGPVEAAPAAFHVYRAEPPASPVRVATVRAGIYDFADGPQGLVRAADRIYSDVGWDAAAQRLRLVSDRRDPLDETLETRIPGLLDDTTSFDLVARVGFRDAGDWQRAFPLFLAADEAARPGDVPGTLAFFVRDEDKDPWLGFRFIDATGVVRASDAVPVAEAGTYQLRASYEASSRLLRLRVEDAVGAALLERAETLPAEATFDFARLGVASDHIPEQSLWEPRLEMWVDDVALRPFGVDAVYRVSDATAASGHTYTYAVTAANAVGESVPTPEVVVALAPWTPTPPRDLVAARGPGEGDVALTWAPPADDGGDAVDTYVVKRTVAQGPEEDAAVVTGTSWIDEGRPDGVHHAYRVVAVNAGGASPPSASASFLPTGWLPGLPRDVLATPGDAPGLVHLAWSAPDPHGSGPLHAWRVLREEGEVATPVADVPVGAMHTFDAGDEGFVRPVDAPYSHVAYDAANARVRLLSDRRDDVDERFERIVPAFDARDGFTLEARFGMVVPGSWQRAWPLYVRAADAPRAGSVAGTAAFTFYGEGSAPRLGFQYVDATGATRLADAVAVSATGAYTFRLVCADGRLTMTILDALGAVLKSGTYAFGSAPGDAAVFAAYGVSNDNEPEWSSLTAPLDAWVDDVAFEPASSRGFDVDVGKGRAATFRVAAVNAFGAGPASAPATATAPGSAPSAPLAVRATTGPGLGVLSLAWDAPTDDGGVGPLAYRVLGGATASTLAPLAEVDAPGFTEAGLPNGTVRWYAVEAVNPVGATASGPVSARTFAVPGAPRDVTVFGYTAGVGIGSTLAPAGDGVVEVRWTAPVDTGEFAALGYRIWRADGEAPFRPVARLGDVRAWYDRPAESGAYHYRVSAENAVGESAAVGSNNVVALAPLGVTGAPPAPVGLPPLPPLPGTGDLDATEPNAPFLLGGERVVLQFDADDHDAPLPFLTRDASGAGRHGDYGATRTAPDVAPGRFGDAYTLGRTRQYIEVSESTLDDLPSGSVSIWINATDFRPLWGGIVAKIQPGVTGEFGMWVDTEGRPGFVTSQRGGTTALVAPTGVPAGRWVHLVATWGPEGKRLYVDGELVAANADATGVGHDSTMTGLGGDPNDAGRTGFAGAFDEFRVYGRALAPDEVRTLSGRAYA